MKDKVRKEDEKIVEISLKGKFCRKREVKEYQKRLKENGSSKSTVAKSVS